MITQLKRMRRKMIQLKKTVKENKINLLKTGSMKKIMIAFMIVLLASSAANSQDFKKVKDALLIAQIPKAGDDKLENAKLEFDKLLTNPKATNKVETFLLKAEIYGLIAGKENLKPKYAGADITALEALKKYLEMEPNEEKLKEDGYTGVNGIYTSFFNDGVAQYQQKNWEASFVKFKAAAEMGDIFVARKWSNSAFDTVSYLYAGASAQNAQKNDEAINYYSKIAEKKIVGPDYESLYDYLAKYFYNNKNQEEFKKYLSLAKAAYPTNPTWADLEFANMTETVTPDEMLKKFNDPETGKTATSLNYFDFGDFFINNKKVKELDSAQRIPYTNAAATAFAKSFDMDTTNAVAAYNSGISFYNLFEDAIDTAKKIIGSGQEIKLKKEQANKIVEIQADKSIMMLEKAFASLAAKSNRTSTEKNVLSKATDILFNLYDHKKEKSKGTNANVNDYDKYEAKAKYYDGLHGKF